MECNLFVNQYLPFAQVAGERFKLNPVVILAQGALETGWGESTLATQHNNFFGLTGYGVAGEYWHGGKTDLGRSGLVFRRYDCPRNSFLDFARLIRSAYSWAADMSYYPDAYASEIAYSRYITELNGDSRADYADTLSRLCFRIKSLVDSRIIE